MELAIWMASSKVSEFDEADDGAEDFFAGDAHGRGDRAEDGGLKVRAVGVDACGECVAAGEQLCAFGEGDLDIFGRGFNLAGIDLGAYLDGFVESVADFEFLCAVDEAGGELGGNSLLEQDAAGGGAALAGGAEGSPERAVEGEIEVGVVHDDLRVFAAHFERDGLEGGGGALADERTDGAGAGKADGADVGVLDEGSADGRAGAGNDIDDAGREAGVDERMHEVVGGERRIGGGLDDAGVAGDEGREELPTGNGHGEVPGSDEADDADGHADAHGELVLQLAGGGLAEEAAAFAGYVEGFVDGFLDVAAGLGEDLAHFAGHVAGHTSPCVAGGGGRRGRGSQHAWARGPGARRQRPFSRRPRPGPRLRRARRERRRPRRSGRRG